jgi:galactokinase
MSAPDALARLTAAARSPVVAGFTGVELVRRLEHFVREDARVPAAARALGAADAGMLDRLSRDSQADAETLLGNQVRATVDLAAAAREGGAFAASSFGAGFGGSVWALALRDEAVEVAERWRRAYRRAFPEIGDVEWFITRPSPGAVELFAVE